MEFEHMTDVVVVGSGAGGLTAAIAARDAGSEVIVLESMDKVGGSTAKSGGGFWIPNNHLMKACGVNDSYEAALTYMNEVIPEKGPASSKEKRETYLKNGPEMLKWLEGLGFKGVYAHGYPDYYPERSGGCAEGRCVESDLFDLVYSGSSGKTKCKLYRCQCVLLKLVNCPFSCVLGVGSAPLWTLSSNAPFCGG